LDVQAHIDVLQHAQGEAYNYDENRQALLTYYTMRLLGRTGQSAKPASRSDLCARVGAVLHRGTR